MQNIKPNPAQIISTIQALTHVCVLRKFKCTLKWKLLTSIRLNWDWNRGRIHETGGSWRRRSARIWGWGRRARRGLGDSKGFRERRRWWELGGEELGLGIWGASTFSILGESLGFLVLGLCRDRDRTQRLCERVTES